MQLDEEPDDTYGARPGRLPWTLELASGARCVWVSGATNRVGSFRLNYFCNRGRYLFGSPDRSRAKRRIRQTRDFNGRAMFVNDQGGPGPWRATWVVNGRTVKTWRFGVRSEGV